MPFLGVVLGLLLAAHLLLLGFFQVSSEDTWWHLKQGELYVTTFSLPAQDPFAFTTAGREWIKYSWLADILFYCVFRAAGLPGLVLFRLLMLGLCMLVLYRILRRAGLHPLPAILLLFLASLALRFRLWIRPELLSFALLLLVLAILLRLRDGPPGLAYALLPVQLLWTNMHASFLFGIAIPGLVLGANLLPGNRLSPGWGRLHLDRIRLTHLTLATASLPLVTLVNPHGLGMLVFPFRQNTMKDLATFAEWAEVWVLPEIDPIWWEVVIVLLVVVLAFLIASALLFRWEGRLDPVGWGIVLSMGTYAILRNRAIPFFVLAILPLLALCLVRLADHLRAQSPTRSFRWLERAGAVACFTVLAASILDQTFLTSRNPFGFGVRSHYFPEGAVAFLERHRLDGRIFNTYEYGGYLTWRRWPANLTFIDGRYDRILFDEALMEAYEQAHRSPGILDRVTATYGVEILLLDANPSRRMAHIWRHPGWARVYWDAVAEVYLRRGGRFAALIGAREYRLTRPDANLAYLQAYRQDPEVWRLAVGELRRAVEDNPENELAWQGLAQEYKVAGPSGLELRLEALTRVTAILAGMRASATLHGERAEVLLELGRIQEAEAAARGALRLDGDLLLPRYVLAAVAERRGAWSQARELLRDILTRLEPGDPRLPNVQENLDNVERRLGGEKSR
jgi:tetratricopeptide (TPR) repeat protein